MKTFKIIILFLFTLFAWSCVSLEKHGTIHHPVTRDGFKLTIEHFPPIAKIKRNYPVIICHGLLSNRNYWKAKEEQSLVSMLQRAGYDVWLMDLRGRRDAGDTGWWFGNKTFTYNVDDYVKDDVDTALSFVLKKTGAEKVNWMGHSMGGMVAYARIGHYKENRIANLVTYGSPTVFVPLSRVLMTWNNAAPGMIIIPSVPIKMAAQWGSLAPIFIPSQFRVMLYHPENTGYQMERKLMWFATNDIAKPEAKQFLYSLNAGELVSAGGGFSYFEELPNIKIPVLTIGGRRDHLADPASVRASWDKIGSDDKTLMLLERAAGFTDDYGHTDMVMGLHAHKEVHPKVIEWLNKRDTPPPPVEPEATEQETTDEP